MSIRFPRLAVAALMLAGAATVGLAAPAFAENSPTNIPIAVDDTYSMMGGTTLTVDYASGLLANDLHAADWTILFVEAVQGDAPGELVLESTYKNGSFTYTPAVGFAGVRTFEYQLRDGDLGVVSENWGLVTITVLDPTLPCAAGTPGCEAPDPGPGDIPCAVGTPGCGPDEPCVAGDPNCVPPVIPPCDPNGPEMEAPGPGEEPTCIGEPTPGDGDELPCAVGTPGCPPPGDSNPGDSDIPCAVGTPGCNPPAILPCDPNQLPQEVGNAVPCLPVDLDIPTPGAGDDSSTVVTELPTLAYTGSTVDFRLAALGALLLVGGVMLAVPRRIRPIE